MSDQDKQERVRAFLDETRDRMKPHLDAMLDGAVQTYRAAATLAGDPITPENEDFWRIAGNLFVCSNGKLDPTGPEIGAFVSLANAIAQSSHVWDWASTRAICERLFDQLDGGEELGLSDDFMDVTDWNDVGQRGFALRKAMQFHRVPRAYQCAIADVVTQLMLAQPEMWHCEGAQLPQPWAAVCTYVVYSMAERVKSVGLGRSGNGVGLH